MRKFKAHLTILLLVLSACSLCAAGHSPEQTNALVASGVNAMYARREDPIGAVAVDKLLAALKPGYYNGAERCACALSLLANENSSSECISYFANVTNGLNSADR